MTTKLHLRVNEHGLPLQLELSPGQAHDAPMAELLLQDLPKGTSLLADRGYDADWIRELIEDQDCTPVIPPKSNRRCEIPFSKRKYKKRNLVERCINKLKQKTAYRDTLRPPCLGISGFRKTRRCAIVAQVL